MSECLVWSISLASTEEQKNESERHTARRENPEQKKAIDLVSMIDTREEKKPEEIKQIKKKEQKKSNAVYENHNVVIFIQK